MHSHAGLNKIGFKIIKVPSDYKVTVNKQNINVYCRLFPLTLPDVSIGAQQDIV